MKKAIVIIVNITAILFVVFLIYVNIALHSAPDLKDREKTRQDVISQLNFLEDELKNNNLGLRMQDLFPEGLVFTNVLYGITSAEVAGEEKQGSEFVHALSEARYAYQQVNAEAAREPFDTGLKPDHGIFYSGWKNYLLAKILEAQGEKDSVEIAEFNSNCLDIADAIANSKSPFLESYSQASWPADAFVGVASLKLHDRIFEPRYDTLIKTWLQKVKLNTDPGTGLVPHSANSISGARGSSICLMLIFMADIDTGFARQQFKLFQENFIITRFGLPAIREYPEGTEGNGDVDSGPVFMDIGSSGTIVSAGTFKRFGDYETAGKISASVETFGFPVSGGGEKKYLFGALPMADVFIAWTRMQQPNPELIQNQEGNDHVHGSINRFHLYSAIIMLLLAVLVFRKKVRRIARNRRRPVVRGEV